MEAGERGDLFVDYLLASRCGWTLEQIDAAPAATVAWFAAFIQVESGGGDG